MPIPVTIPSGSLVTTPSNTARAEEFVAAIAQLMKSGSIGAPGNNTLPTVLANPNTLDVNSISTLELSTRELQLPYRQIALALAETLVELASSTVIGVSKLSSDPSVATNPTALNSEEVTTVPTPNKIPRAYPTGLIDSGWVGTPSGTPIPDSVFNGTCQPTDAVGNFVRMTGSPGNDVVTVDYTSFSTMPAIGVILSKASSTTCVVQTNSLISGVFGSSLVPGKIHFIDSIGKAVYPAPIPGATDTFFHQPIGIAVTNNSLLLLPSGNLTRVKGSSV